MINSLNNRKGFTLLELILALAITFILGSIVSATLTSSDKRKLEEAASMLQSDMRYAQRMSVVEGRRYLVIFNLVDNYYVVRRKQTDAASSYDGETKTVYLQDGVKILSTNAHFKTVNYTPTGTTGDACTIALSSGKYRIDLTVAVGSGRISKKEVTKVE